MKKILFLACLLLTGCDQQDNWTPVEQEKIGLYERCVAHYGEPKSCEEAAERILSFHQSSQQRRSLP